MKIRYPNFLRKIIYFSIGSILLLFVLFVFLLCYIFYFLRILPIIGESCKYISYNIEDAVIIFIIISQKMLFRITGIIEEFYV